MGKTKVNPERKRQAIIEVATGKKKLTDAARELGVAKSTLHESVAKTKQRTAAAFTAGPATTTTASLEAPPPPAPAASGPEKSNVDKILEAAGLKPKTEGSDVTAPIKPEDAAAAAKKSEVDIVDYCIKKSEGIKGLSVFAISRKYKIPASDPAMKQWAALSEPLKIEIQANADFLFPYLKKFSGPGLVAGIFLMEMWQTMGLMKEHGMKHHGYVPRAARQEQPQQPTPQQQQARALEQARPAETKPAPAAPAPQTKLPPGAVAADPFAKGTNGK